MEIIKNKDTGFKIKGKNAVVTLATDSLTISDKEGNEFKVPGAGEYEVKEVGIIGLLIRKTGENVTATVIYRLTIDEINIGFLSNLSDKLTDSQAETIDGVDILLVPSALSQVVSQLEPVIVIPYGNTEETAKFLKNLGKEDLIAVPKLVTSKDKLPQELQIVILE